MGKGYFLIKEINRLNAYEFLEELEKQIEIDYRLKECERILKKEKTFEEKNSKNKNETNKKRNKMKNNRKEDEIFIPLKMDNRTTIYVRESDIFKPEYISRFGRKFLEKRVSLYKKFLPYKPEGIVYWNPF